MKTITISDNGNLEMEKTNSQSESQLSSYENTIFSCDTYHYMYYVYALVLGAYVNVKKLYKLGLM
jgi:hypothetical protein